MQPIAALGTLPTKAACGSDGGSCTGQQTVCPKQYRNPPAMNQLFSSIRWILLALFLGAGLGLVFPEAAPAISPVSKLMLQLIKAAATPLVFFAVLEAILRYNVAGGDFLKLFTVVLINAICAISIGLLAANIFEPGQYLTFLAVDM
ncbi:MAG TPA: hypothetical protein DCO82_05430, partial [Alphaproteobacteria bacterium]|nr:hypothetical protein [Alphaproteobacteria bacterium]